MTSRRFIYEALQDAGMVPLGGRKKDSCLMHPGIPHDMETCSVVGECHTLILSGEHCLVACNLRLTTSRYLTPNIRQSVKFRDMPEVKRKHCSDIVWSKSL